jgi:hypothetical protein
MKGMPRSVRLLSGLSLVYTGSDFYIGSRGCLLDSGGGAIVE